MPHANSAFASFEQKWLGEFPENVMVAVFLPGAQRAGANAFGSLVHELMQTAFYRSEAHIATTKLAWWRQELIDAHAGRPRHPVTTVLFADACLQASDPSLWPALADAALGQIGRSSATNLTELMQRFQPWHVSVARADAAVFSIRPEVCDRAAALWTITHLLHDLARIPTRADAGQLEHVALPLDLLARHGILRADLFNHGSARNAFVRDYLDGLLGELDQCLDQGVVLSLPRRVRTALDRGLILRARYKTDPLAWLAAQNRPGFGRSLWTAWNMARRSGVA